MSSEMVVLVDDQDNAIGFEEKIQAHRLGLLHRAFSVFVVRERNNEIETLLQQRYDKKYHCGGLWTNTCCSHPRSEEQVIAAAERRLQEEMGLHISLRAVGSFMYRAEFANGLVEHEFDHVLIGKYNDEAIKLNPQEVQAYRWVTLSSLQEGLITSPHLYTPWLKPALEIVIANMEETL